MNLDLTKIASLSHLDISALTEDQQSVLRNQLQAMVALADQVRSAPIDGLAPLYHPLELTQPLRPDRAESTQSFRAALLANAPQHDEASFLVPKVIE